MKVRSKVLVVTGAGSGMCRELALALLRRGARVAAVDVRPDGLEETAALAAAGERLSTHVLDITDRAACEALPEDVISRHGAVDGLINNAGIIQPFVTIEALDYATIERVLTVNLSAPGGAGAADASRYPTTSAPDAARIMLDGFEAGRLHIFVGRDSRLMNAAIRVAPRQATHLIQKQMKKLMPST